MAKTSSSPSKSTKKTVPKSNNESKNVKKIHTKYASKLVSKVMDIQIENKLKSVTKNPKSTRKWIEKMKLSVLKKISVATRTLFAVKSQEATLIEQRDEARAKISELQARIQTKLQTFSEKIHPQTLVTPQLEESFIINEIEDTSSSVKLKMQDIGNTIHILKRKLADEAQSLSQTIKNIEHQFNHSDSGNSNINNNHNNQSPINTTNNISISQTNNNINVLKLQQHHHQTNDINTTTTTTTTRKMTNTTSALTDLHNLLQNE